MRRQHDGVTFGVDVQVSVEPRGQLVAQSSRRCGTGGDGLLEHRVG